MNDKQIYSEMINLLGKAKMLAEKLEEGAEIFLIEVQSLQLQKAA